MANPNIGGATNAQLKNLKEAQALGKALGLEYENIADIQRMILSNQVRTKQELLEQLRLAREAQDIVENDVRLEQERAKRIQEQVNHTKKLNEQRKVGEKLNEDIASIDKQISNLAKTMFSNTSDTYDQQKKLLAAKKAEILEQRRAGNINADVARNLVSQIEAQEKILENVQKIHEEYKGQFEQLSALGGLLGRQFGIVGKAIEGGINKGMAAFTEELAVSGDKTKAMEAAMKAFGGEMTASIAKAMSVVGIITLLYNTLKSITDEANQLALETGLTFSQARQLAGQSKIVAANMGLQLATAKDIVDVQKETMAAFGTSAMLSNEQAANVAEMGKAFGYGAAQAGKVNNVFMSMGATADEAAGAQQSLAAEALKAGVNVGAVTKDIAENAKNTAKYFGGNVTAIKNAAIEAAKMGMTLATMAKVADKLLDVESSMTAQFEFQALSGKQIDLDLARQLALEGDIAGASKEVLSAVGSVSEFNELGVLQRQKLAESVGMEVDELQKSLVVQEKLGDLTEEQKAAMSGLNVSAAELANMSKEDIQAKLAAQQSLNQANKQLDDFMNTMKTALVPLAEALGVIFAGLAPALKLVAAPIIFIRDIMNAITALFTGGFDALTGWGQALAVIGTVLTVAFLPTILSAAFGLLGSAIGAVWTGLSMIPFGLGIPLAIAAVGGLISAFMGPISKAQSVGDAAFGAGGDTAILSRTEGTIFPSQNDEIAVGPGVIGMAQAGGAATAVPQSGDADSALAAVMQAGFAQLANILNKPKPAVINWGDRDTTHVANQVKADSTLRSTYQGQV